MLSQPNSFTALSEASAVTTDHVAPRKGKKTTKRSQSSVVTDESTSASADTSSQALRAADGLPGILSARPSGSGASPAGSSPRRHADPPNLSLCAYFTSELNPSSPEPAQMGHVERRRVYNAIVSVPYQLERLLWYGTLLCLDSFLGIFTVLPIRFVCAVSTLIGKFALRRPGICLQGYQIFDILCVFIFAATVALLHCLPAGKIYFWMKDLNQEFLKLHVIYSAVEICDKVCCAFAVDSLEALSGTCWWFASDGRAGVRHAAARRARLAADTVVAGMFVAAHGAVLLCQGMAFSVAVNSARSYALIALLIASNFVEVKGTVFKRFDSPRIFLLACQDVVERCHLLLTLAFVTVEEMVNSGTPGLQPALVRRCAAVFGAEVVIDIIKHAVLGRFNQIRPGVYRDFMKDVCEKAGASQSHNVHRILAFHPFAPAALFLRISATFMALRHDKPSGASWGLYAAGAAALWLVLLVAKLALGYCVRWLACLYLRHAVKQHKE